MSGAARALRAPLLLLVLYGLTVVAVIPFAVVLGARLQAALASQQVTHDPERALDADIDAEWWFEFIRHARGLEATFTPAIVGSAAPLSSVSALLDGEFGSLALVAPVAVYAVLWAFLWGGVLHRLHDGNRGVRAFAAAGGRTFVPFVLLAIAAAGVYVALYATVHAVLFGPVFGAIQADATRELTAFLWRVAFYLVFGMCLMAVSLLVDFTRVFTVVGRTSLIAALRTAASFLGARWRSAAGAYLLVGGAFLALLVAYTIVDVYGGARVGGWRAVILGQAFVMARIALRVVLAGAELELAVASRGVAYRSTAEVKPGPPAAT